MKEQFSMIIELFEKMFTPAAVSLSAMIATGVSAYSTFVFKTDLFGVSLLFVGLVLGLMAIDWGMGTYASVKVKKEKFDPDKIGYSIMKFVFFMIWLFAVSRSINELHHFNWMVDILSFIHVFVVILIMLREFVSIGNKQKIIYGEKNYLFELLDTVFSTLERLFIKKLESKIDEINTETEETKNDDENGNTNENS